MAVLTKTRVEMSLDPARMSACATRSGSPSSELQAEAEIDLARTRLGDEGPGLSANHTDGPGADIRIRLREAGMIQRVRHRHVEAKLDALGDREILQKSEVEIAQRRSP